MTSASAVRRTIIKLLGEVDINGYIHLLTDKGNIRVNHAERPGQLNINTATPKIARYHLEPKDGPIPLEDYETLVKTYYGYPNTQAFQAGRSVIVYASFGPITEYPRLPEGATHAR